MYGPFEVDDVDEAIEQSTKMASAHESILNMADKFDTQVIIELKLILRYILVRRKRTTALWWSEAANRHRQKSST